jgi:hypothetical protein
MKRLKTEPRRSSRWEERRLIVRLHETGELLARLEAAKAAAVRADPGAKASLADLAAVVDLLTDLPRAVERFLSGHSERCGPACPLCAWLDGNRKSGSRELTEDVRAVARLAGILAERLATALPPA